MENKVLSLDVIEIQEYQKNRYPYLFIDRITECVPGKYAKGFKNLTIDEWFFPPHYDTGPIMPGALQVEAMAQVFIMTFLTLSEYKGKLVTGLGYNNVRFHQLLVPGDRFDLEAELISFRRGIARGKAAGYIGDKLVCESELLMGIPEIISKFTPK
jgi:3-hydroxyacyl-[acyl-carrier-protein] dehydratase